MLALITLLLYRPPLFLCHFEMRLNYEAALSFYQKDPHGMERNGRRSIPLPNQSVSSGETLSTVYKSFYIIPWLPIILTYTHSNFSKPRSD